MRVVLVNFARPIQWPFLCAIFSPGLAKETMIVILLTGPPREGEGGNDDTVIIASLRLVPMPSETSAVSEASERRDRQTLDKTMTRNTIDLIVNHCTRILVSSIPSLVLRCHDTGF